MVASVLFVRKLFCVERKKESMKGIENAKNFRAAIFIPQSRYALIGL